MSFPDSVGFGRAQKAQPERWKPRVTLYTDSVEPSGVGEHVIQLARGLANQVSVSLIVNDAPASKALAGRARKAGICSRVVPHGPSFELEFFGLLRLLRPHILHIHAGIGWEGWQAPPVARRGGVAKIVRTEHLPYLLDKPDEEARYKAGIAGIDAVICVSGHSHASYVRAGITPDLLNVVQNGTSPPAYNGCRIGSREALGFSDDDVLILTVARLTEQKGHRVLLEAAPKVIQEFPRARFLWAGAGPLFDELQKRARDLGLSENVLLLGQRADVPDLLAASDLYVLPSLFEGLPLSLLEAHYAHLPVIASRAPGTAEAIIDRETGVLVDPGNSEQLAAAIQWVLGDPAFAARLAGAGARHAATHFSAERMARETLDIYYRQLSEPAVARAGPSEDEGRAVAVK